MKTVSLDEAASNLESLLDEAARGEAFVIVQAGKPLVKVGLLEEPRPERELPTIELADPVQRLGFARGLFSVPDDFDTMYQADIERMFYENDGLPDGSDPGLENPAFERKVRER